MAANVPTLACREAQGPRHHANIFLISTHTTCACALASVSCAPHWTLQQQTLDTPMEEAHGGWVLMGARLQVSPARIDPLSTRRIAGLILAATRLLRVVVASGPHRAIVLGNDL